MKVLKQRKKHIVLIEYTFSIFLKLIIVFLTSKDVAHDNI